MGVTVHLDSNTKNIFNKLANMERLTTGNLNEKDFWSAQCMVCTGRFTMKNVNDSRQFVKVKGSLNFPGLQYSLSVSPALVIQLLPLVYVNCQFFAN